MTRRPSALLLLVGTAALLPACGLWRHATGSLKAPAVVFQSAAVEGLSLDAATVAATFRVDNPNPVALHVAEVTWELSVADEKVLDGRQPAELRLAASGSAPLVVRAQVPFRGALRLADRLGERDEAPYRVKGVAAVRTPLGMRNVPFSWEGVLPVPRLPSVALSSARLELQGFTSVRAVLSLAVNNRNSFALPLEGAGFRLVAQGRALGAAAVAARPLPARETVTVELPVEISASAAGAALQDLLAGRAVQLRLQGEARMGGQVLPLDLGVDLQ